MTPTLFLATSALLRALGGPVDAAELDAAATASAAEPATAPARGHCRDQSPAGASLRLAEDSEPGQRLIVTGRVVAGDGRTPVAGIMVYAYQADAAGRYSARGGPDDNQSPRLCGVLRTDAAGRFRLDSVRPGSYAGGGSAHIHFEVWREGGARRPFVLTFEEQPAPRGADPAAAAAAGERGADRRPVVRDARGVWHCVRDLRLS